jgi:hypothetical protein
MALRVGSPKADVMADTVAVNAFGVITGVGWPCDASASPRFVRGVFAPAMSVF